ncbi:MAG: energy-coupling factor transporter ATP-binding protein EcfA2 [Crocinitomicaceae bacterium]|jgi:energy-coupling factor transporter ATP-binding protein EcfA2
MQISEIILNNYRAFYNEKGQETEKYRIDFSGKKNLLIYGENGSGKSSLFKGVKDLFGSSVQPDLSLVKNVFSIDKELDIQPFVEIAFKDGAETNKYRFSADPGETNTDEVFLKAIARTRNFMTYRDLLRVHFVDDPEVNLFKFLFTGDDALLGEITNPSFSQPETNIKMKDLWNIVSTKPDKINIADFCNGVNQIMFDLSNSLNSLLTYFDDSLEVKFELLSEEMVQNSGSKLTLKVNYYGIELNGDTEQYHHFLNEARLSALAICIFLAAHLSVPKPAYEILFLDDIFTGLDNSNRMPLLDILTAEIITGTTSDTFKDHQILLTTYDRQWYELARHYLGDGNWSYQEIFIDRHPSGFDQPTILPGVDDLKKAQYYFKMKGYPACANHQRKICERLIKDFLPENLKYKRDGNGDIKLRDQLGELTDVLFKYLNEIGIDTSPIKNFPICMRVVLNPFSHDDTHSQIYRRELEVAFNMIEILKTLKSSVILSGGTKVYLEKNHKETGILHKYEFEVATNVNTIEFQGNNYVTNITLLPLVLDIADTPRLMSQSGKIDILYNKICHFLKVDKDSNYYNEFKLSQGESLSTLIPE